MLAYLLLALAQAAGLLIILLGWPGGWLQLGALALFDWYSAFEAVGMVPLALLAAVVLLTEVARFVFAPGTHDALVKRRATAVSLAGGTFGAAAGVLFPLVGPLFGALAGALVASAAAAISAPPGQPDSAPLAGQLVAAGLRSAAGLAIAAVALFTFIR